MDHTSFSQIVIDIMVIFMALGAVDRITHGKLKIGLGDSFDEGFKALGTLALTMLGILAITPALSNVLLIIVSPVYELIGADPAMFAGTVLGCDMGGYPLAMEMAGDRDAGLFSGLILGSLLGAVIIFTIPVGIGMIEKDDIKYFAKGVLCGIVTIPIGAFAGGLVACFDLHLLLINSIPTVIVSALIALGLKFAQDALVKGFIIFGKFIVSLLYFGLACAIIKQLTGIEIIKGMAPISDGFVIIGNIAIILAGAFPMLYIIQKVFYKPFERIGGRLGMNSASVAGFVASIANVIPMFTKMKDMDKRGKVLNSAFAVGGAFILGDHLAFVASVEKEMIAAVIAAKAVAGISAVLLAWLVSRKE